MRCSTGLSGPFSTKLQTAWSMPLRARPTCDSVPRENLAGHGRCGIRPPRRADPAPRAASCGKHGRGRCGGERPRKGARALRPGTRGNLRESGPPGDDRAGRRPGGNIPALAGRSEGPQAGACSEETPEDLISAAELRDVGTRPRFGRFDLRVIHVIALALVVDLRYAAADLVIREELHRVAAVRFLDLGFGGFLGGFFRRLGLILL